MLNVTSSRPDRLGSASACGHQVGGPHPQSCKSCITGTAVVDSSHLWNPLLSCCLLIFTQVHRYPPKYQIYLKSINGPIEVLLLNKRSVSAPPLVLPVPPPEDLLRNTRVDTLADLESDTAPCQAPVYPSHSSRLERPAMKDLWSSCFLQAEPSRAPASGGEHRTVMWLRASDVSTSSPVFHVFDLWAVTSCKNQEQFDMLKGRFSCYVKAFVHLMYFPPSSRRIKRNRGTSAAHQR